MQNRQLPANLSPFPSRPYQIHLQNPRAHRLGRQGNGLDTEEQGLTEPIHASLRPDYLVGNMVFT